MLPTSYNLGEMKKTVVAFVVAVIALAAFFIHFDPGFNDAAIAVIAAGFNVAGVFLAKNHTVDDVQKTLQAFTASAIALVAFYVTIDPTDSETIFALVAAAVNVFGVYKLPNSGRGAIPSGL